MAIEEAKIKQNTKSLEDLQREQLEGQKSSAPAEIDDNDYSMFPKLGNTRPANKEEITEPTVEKKQGYGDMLNNYYDTKLKKKEDEHVEKTADLSKRKNMANLSQGLRLIGDLSGAFAGANVKKRESNEFDKLVGEMDDSEVAYRNESEKIQDLMMQGKLSDYQNEQKILQAAELAKQKRTQDQEDAADLQKNKIDLENVKQGNAIDLAKAKAELDKLSPTDKAYKEAITKYNIARANQLTSKSEDNAETSNIVGDWGSVDVDDERLTSIYNEGVNHIDDIISDEDLIDSGYKLGDLPKVKKQLAVKSLGDALVASGMDKGEVTSLIESGDINTIKTTLENFTPEINEGEGFWYNLMHLRNKNGGDNAPVISDMVDVQSKGGEASAIIPNEAPLVTEDYANSLSNDKMSQKEKDDFAGLTDDDIDFIMREFEK